MSYFKPISISLSPNVEKDDVKLALNLIIRPWLWLDRPGRNGKAIQEVENNFKKYLGVKYAVSFNSGRSSLYAILKALNLENGSNVALQAFTCNAVPNPVLWADLEPLYIDCNTDDFNLSVSDLRAKINLRTRVVVVQHVFGQPANMDQLRAVAHIHLALNLIILRWDHIVRPHFLAFQEIKLFLQYMVVWQLQMTLRSAKNLKKLRVNLECRVISGLSSNYFIQYFYVI
jgi:hypothetical protein